MKKTFVITANVFIMIVMLIFVVLYSNLQSKETVRIQVEHFENTTIAMERVTENYLEGEQRICDVWARYINSRDMTIEDATSFIRISHVLPNASAHIVFIDTLSGLSTKAHSDNSGDYTVSYKRMELLEDLSWISDIGESINISRAYTNPVSGEQSLAFCNLINLHDTETGDQHKAVLLRVLPVSDLEQKWIFPQEEYENAEISMIDTNGNYIIKDHSFKNSNFFEFYRSYNTAGNAASQEFTDKITSTTGSVSMYNSRGEECILAYTPVDTKAGWSLLSIMPMKELQVRTENWLLVCIVSAGLLILFLFDLSVMIRFNQKLQATAKEAASASKAKTDFLSAMSHDIRTPMNAIIGLTEIMKNDPGDAENVKKNLEKISLASNHLLTLINDILDISKVESGKLKLNPQTFSVTETVENLENIIQPMIKEKNLDLSIRSRIEKEYLIADELRLNQIFINILSNAVKYTESGGRITVDVNEDESHKPGCVQLTYRVSDTGIGMSPEYMKNMYQPFTRQTDSRVNSIQGTGLGLAITKQMVDLMEGTIDCQSGPGKGTTFTVCLDIPVAEQQKEKMKSENDDSDLNGINILVAEDFDVNWEIITTLLGMYGITTERAENGLICVEKMKSAAEGSYDFIFMDIQMPELNGIEATKRIRELDDIWASSIPIIAMTADAFSENVTECMNAGMNGHISKPVDIDLVIKEIRRIKEEKRE